MYSGDSVATDYSTDAVYQALTDAPSIRAEAGDIIARSSSCAARLSGRGRKSTAKRKS
jgi:hypothetical protein